MKSVKQYLVAVGILIGSALQQSGSAQTVDLVPVVAKSVSRMIDLPGEFQPFLSVALHARVTGYVENVLVLRVKGRLGSRKLLIVNELRHWRSAVGVLLFHFSHS